MILLASLFIAWIKKLKSNLPTGVPHDLVSVVGPVHPVLHSLPLIHALDRVIVPDPHRTEQALHGPNAPILDGTKKEKKVLVFVFVEQRSPYFSYFTVYRQLRGNYDVTVTS